MRKIEKYTGDKTFMFPSGAIATPEVMSAQYPAFQTFAHIIETDEGREVIFAVQNLSAARSMYGVDPALAEAEAISAIEVIINTPPAPSEPSAEERIAAAMEFQNVMSL